MYANGKSFTVDSKKMLEAGKLIAIRSHTRFAPFPRHAHNYVEIMYMCSGKTTHVINDGTPLTLHAGELLFLNQHACHAIEKAGAEDVAVNFMILPQFFDTALEMLSEDNALAHFLLGSLQSESNDITYLHFKVADVLPIQNLVENMVWSIVNHQPNARGINQTTMGLLLLQLLNYTQCIDVPPKKDCANALVVAALREIEENYKTASLSRIAAQNGVALAYISQLVKESTGSTYTVLLQQKRLAKAVALLRGTKLSTQDIIAAVGYDNTSYFYRIFKQRHGITPKEYRKL